ncbi:acyltransferase family protein [Prevotella jejuni]
MEELDFLKFVFITLMIAFHLTYIGDTYPVAKQLVYTFHMPGFLLVSGYLFNVNKSWAAFGKTMLWIFIPYTLMESGYTVMASLLPIREHIDHLTVGILIDHIFLHPMGPYWYLHTLVLCGISYYLAFKRPKRAFSSSIKQEKTLLPIKMMSSENQVLLGKFTLFALFLWLLSYGCGLLSIANAAYFLIGALVRQSVGNFRQAFPGRWWTVGLLVVWCIDPSHYDKATFAGACVVFLVISTLLWVYQLGIPQPLRNLFLFIGRNTLPLLLFSPIFTILAKYYQSLLLRMEPTGMLFLVVSVAFAIAGSYGITWLMDVTGLSKLFFGKKGLI